MGNKSKFIYALFFMFILIFPFQVLAHEGDPNMDANSSPWLLEQGDDHEDDGHHGHSSDHAEAGHHEEYEETGANVPILSTFAAINSGFILYGAIRKYNQKKGLVLK